jgi:hypothetical protein
LPSRIDCSGISKNVKSIRISLILSFVKVRTAKAVVLGPSCSFNRVNDDVFRIFGLVESRVSQSNQGTCH